ncbi:hypothetical protein Mesil_3284 (plasmid) [Allomeiothermus silvanus DSM 9946]|uniref:Uncharacterized protein n=1 Tax=Allomeiothermus silvanus (strain ATCC 700542 / DSM 9946 / NBRC 106475 / NCIMB 13440 / VI-R2) TaxID=526227 RepID=D7BIU2_ALLS1|nr:hypothetical protein Mesil_3284 [Allomeiothermus silvanus DSM 9946]
MGHQRSPRHSCRAGKAAQSRPSLHLEVARIIHAQTRTDDPLSGQTAGAAVHRTVFPKYSHPNSPKTYTLPQLAACVVLCFYFKMSYRDFVELLRMSQELREALELEAVPHYRTLSRMYQRFRASHLDEMNRQLLQSLGVVEEAVALDSTGFRPTQARAYFQTRRGRPFRSWVKGSYAVGTRSQLILGVLSGRGPSGDSSPLSTLKRRVSPYGKRGDWVILADGGFDGRGVGSRDLIPPLRHRGALKATKAQGASRVGISGEAYFRRVERGVAHKALHFLQHQAHLDLTDYPRFKREGIEVIGPGQIEGANKHVIGQRLKITGAHWSESGASAKALVRSRFFSHNPVTPFHAVRHAAFPTAA